MTARFVLALLLLTPVASMAGKPVSVGKGAIRRPAAAVVRPRPATQVARAAQPVRPPAVVEEEEKLALEIPDLRTLEEADGVTRALRELRGVKLALIDLKTRLAVVDYLPSETGLPAVLDACKSAGFPATEYRVQDRFPKPIKIKGG